MSSGRPSPLDIPARVSAVVAAAQERKAVDLRVLHLEPVSDLADFFLICSGTNDRQTRAIADAVEKKLREERVRPLHVEGERGGQWILLDYGDFVVHVMSETSRDYYALERIWADAADVTARFEASAEVSRAAPATG